MPTWDEFVQAQPLGHILQTTAWGQLKSRFGWQTETVQVADGGALVLLRRLPLGFTLAYVPRGPLVNWETLTARAPLLTALDQLCRAHRAICLKIEPDLPDTDQAAAQLAALGFRPSPQTVQPRRTLVVDIRGTEADILSRMKQKTRYNIRLAEKKEVTARAAATPADVEAFVELMRVTGTRDNFGVHTPAYYRAAYQLFQPAGRCELFLAEYNGAALAGVMVFGLGQRAWYFYGASSNQERQRMAPYLAQWAALRWAKTRGAQTYDLYGVPDEPEATLEAQFENRHDGLWGVYRTKRGWGGQLTRTLGAWDRVYHPPLYWLYRQYLQNRA